MQTVNDPVFGTMTYKHSWKGTCNVLGLGQIVVTAQAYPGESISNAQRESFQVFSASSDEFLSAATTALVEYATRIYPGTDVTKLHPEEVLFQQNGVWGFIYPSPVGEDDGLSVRFQNGQVVADTDDALL